MMTTHIQSITIEPVKGAPFRETAEEAIDLANGLPCEVILVWNTARLSVKYDDTPESLGLMYANYFKDKVQWDKEIAPIGGNPNTDIMVGGG